MKQTLTLALVQPDIRWEDPFGNLEMFGSQLEKITPPADLILLPELFATGFTMRSRDLAEPPGGMIMQWMAAMAIKHDCTLAGSVAIQEDGAVYNRLIWMQNDGSHQSYDKRHLFRMSGENEHYSPGNTQLVTELKGFRFRPLICYDLRFPVWSRNRQDYDVLLYLSNWPEPRRDVWNTLLKARALENQAWCAGVNRIGTDGMGIYYAGESQVVDPKGKKIAFLEEGYNGTVTVHLELGELNAFRNKFPVFDDADDFSIRS